MNVFRSLHGIALFSAALSLPAIAAVPIVTTAGTFTYQQNFNALFTPSSSGLVNASPAWADNSTIPNWWFAYAGNGSGAALGGTALAYFGSDGTSSISSALTLVSAGGVSNSDRSFCTPSTTSRGEQSGVVIFQNTGTTTVELSRVQYNGEVRRTNTTSGTVESIFTWYRTATSETAALSFTTAAVNTTVFPSSVSSAPNAQYISGWTQIDSARWTYTSPSSGSATNVSVPIDSTAAGGITGARVGPGQFLAVRFSNINDANTDALMGIDDLVMTFQEVASPITPVVTNVVRNDNGTPANPADDNVTFTLTVNGTGAGLTEWTLTGPSTGEGAYDTPQTITAPISAFTAGDHSRTWTVTDAANATLTNTFSVVAPWCSIAATVSDYAYDDGGTASTVDDVVRFNINPTASFGGPNVLIDLGVGQQPFPYGSPIPLSRLPGSEINLVLTDSADPFCTGNVAVNLPGVLGVKNLNGTPGRMLSAPDSSTNRLWTFDNAAPSITQTNAPANSDRSIQSEVIDLSTTGEMRVTAVLDAIAGNSSGFESADRFRFDIIVDGGAPVSILGTADANSDGFLTGASSNGAELPDASQSNVTFTFSFSAVIPASANSLQLRIVGNSNSSNETFVVRNIVVERNILPFVTGNTAMGIKPGTSGKIAIASLAALSSNPAGPVTLTSVQSPTSAGARVAIEGAWVVYQPVEGATGIDNFNFTLSDGTSTASGHVTVAIAPGIGQTFNVLGVTPEGNARRVTGLGIPGRTYAWEYSTDLQTWTILAPPAVCPPTGVLTILDNGPLPSTRFYRAVQR